MVGGERELRTPANPSAGRERRSCEPEARAGRTPCCELPFNAGFLAGRAAEEQGPLFCGPEVGEDRCRAFGSGDHGAREFVGPVDSRDAAAFDREGGEFFAAGRGVFQATGFADGFDFEFVGDEFAAFDNAAFARRFRHDGFLEVDEAGP